MKKILFVLGLAAFLPQLLMPTITSAEKETTRAAERQTVSQAPESR